MTKDEIKKALMERHTEFVTYINSLSEQNFMSSSQNKWTAGQQLDHICRSTAPLVLGLKLPAFIPKLLFGTLKRPARDYAELVKKYQSVLDNGGKASGRFIPKKVDFNGREKLKNQLLENVAKINNALDSFSDSDLDRILLPHPLLGKLTIREMMYFTLYHVDHHKAQAILNLKSGAVKA